jgi:OOP family OmpA-OmpF porin
MKRIPALAQFVIAALIGAGLVAFLTTLGDDDGSSSDQTTAAAAQPTPVPTPTTQPTPDTESPTPTAEPTLEPTAIPEPTATPEATPTPEPAPTTDPAAEPLPEGVEESRAIVKNGQIVLEGAVPDEASAEEIVALAAAILGPENVINNYVIDPRAGDPNLGNIRVDDTVLFATNSADIAPEFEPLLAQALALMLTRPSVTMTVEGHTDDIGSDETNLILSQDRAQAVVDWLVERGVERSRLTPVGKGETDPAVPNTSAENQQINRRIQVFIFNLLAD